MRLAQCWQRRMSQSYQTVSRNPRTYYEFFPSTLVNGPPPSGRFEIDKHNLHREFLQLQAIAHPDRHSPEFQEHAAHESACINEAYKTLVNPLSRAQYLLELRNIDFKEDELLKKDIQLLNEVMETQEAIEEAAAHNSASLTKLKEDNERKIENSLERMGKAFESDDLEIAKSETIRLKFFMNIRSQLD